ncbi:zinc finger protein 567-like [Bacillus rossius redtenbacheri]|uniref:zinc finger protein 567-like n=1 Tax=Bacillus rossius redtenbacheri TaxID=93214 RepID=UPI002FDE1784
MALVCAAASCKVTVKHGEISDVAFFQFPEDEDLCRIWSMRSARYDLLGKISSEVHATEYLCHLHFEEHAFEKTSMGFILKTDAKPSLFSHDMSEFAAQIEEERSTNLERLFVRPEIATVHYGTSQEGVNIITFHVEVNHKGNGDSTDIPASPSGLHKLENGIYLEPGLFIHSKEQDVSSGEFESEAKALGQDQDVPACVLEKGVQAAGLGVQAGASGPGADPGEPGQAAAGPGQLCRVCAGRQDDLVPVFEEQGLEIRLSEKILMHLPIQVKADDQLPDKVCYKCVAQLNSWHGVVTMCLMADRKLRRMFGVPDITEREVELLAEDKRVHKLPDHQIDKTIEFVKKELSLNDDLVESVLTLTDTQSEVPVLDEVMKNDTVLEDSCVTLKNDMNDMVSGGKYQVSKVVDVCVESMDPGQDSKTTFRMELCRDVEKDGSQSGTEGGEEEKDPVVWKCKICGHVADGVSGLLDHGQAEHCSVRRGCRSCSAVFDGPAAQSDHECGRGRDAGGRLPAKFVCDACDKGFRLKKALREHLLRAHCAESPFKCGVCRKTYGSHAGLDIHAATHSSETPYLCDECGKSFKHITNLRGHKRSHLAAGLKNTHACRLCGAGFRSRFHLSEHLNVHEGRKPYACQDCGKGFSRKIQLRQHRFSHSAARPFKCHLCSACFNRSGNLTQHVKRHFKENKFTCKVCNSAFSTMGEVVTHRRTHTQEEVERSIVNSVDVPSLAEKHKCKTCGKMLARKESLVSHMRMHSGEKMFECKICGKKLSNKGSLNYHLRSFHTGERPYACQFCGDCFVSKESRVVHERTHTGEKPYKCQVCDQAFRCGSNLYQHAKVHANARPFQCQACGKQFQRKGALNVHMRIHTGERPYPCDHCGRTFVQKNDMLKHRRTHLKVAGGETRPRAARRAKVDATPSVDDPAAVAVVSPATVAQPLLITHELMEECAISMPIGENTHSLILQTY